MSVSAVRLTRNGVMLPSVLPPAERTAVWRVVVHDHGDIGCVAERTESLARCAALSKFGEPGRRSRRDGPSAIYEDDEFDVRQVTQHCPSCQTPTQCSDYGSSWRPAA